MHADTGFFFSRVSVKRWSVNAVVFFSFFFFLLLLVFFFFSCEESEKSIRRVSKLLREKEKERERERERELGSNLSDS